MALSRLGTAACIATAAIAGLAFSISANQPASTRLVLLQEPPDLQAIPLKTGEASLGDLLLFDAPFAAEDGSMGGILVGSLLVADMAESGVDGAEMVQSRLTNLVFNVVGKGTIVVGGSAVYPSDSAAEMVASQPQVRAIVGGTGEFIGASGEISTTRSDDGSYVHDLTLLD
jgi:hypothetical protein